MVEETGMPEYTELDQPESDKTQAALLHYKRLGRELAMQYLFECDLSGENRMDEQMELFWEQAEQSGEFPSERVFHKARLYAEKLIAGVQEHELELTELLEQYSRKWDISRMSAVDRNILRIALFEMKFVPTVPYLVSIDEAIEIAKDFGGDNSSVFINGLLNGVKNSLPPRGDGKKNKSNRK